MACQEIYLMMMMMMNNGNNNNDDNGVEQMNVKDTVAVVRMTRRQQEGSCCRALGL
jgi:hypothetical protein